MRRLVLVLTMTALVATTAMVSAVPGSAQTSGSSGQPEIAQADPQATGQRKERRERREKAVPKMSAAEKEQVMEQATPEQKAAVAQKAKEEDKALPKTGGSYPVAHIAGLAGAAMLLGGLLVYRRTR